MAHQSECSAVDSVVQLLSESGLSHIAEAVRIILNAAMRIECSPLQGTLPFTDPGNRAFFMPIHKSWRKPLGAGFFDFLCVLALRGVIWLPRRNPLHNRSRSPAVNRKPSISTGYQRSGRSRRGRSGVDPDFIPLPDNHQISWLVPGFFDFIDHNMVKPLKIALCQFLQGSNRLFEGQSLLRQQIEIFFGNPKIARACVDRLV